MWINTVKCCETYNAVFIKFKMDIIGEKLFTKTFIKVMTASNSISKMCPEILTCITTIAFSLWCLPSLSPITQLFPYRALSYESKTDWYHVTMLWTAYSIGFYLCCHKWLIGDSFLKCVWKYSRDMPELSGKKFFNSLLIPSMDIGGGENNEICLIFSMLG